LTTLEDLRSFRLIGDQAVAHVAGAEGATWDLSAVAERVFGPKDEMSENLTALVTSSAEAQWLRRAGMSVTLVERTLLAGDECYVIGSARAAQPYELVSDDELARTGTDDVSSRVSSVARSGDPDLLIERDGPLEFLRISDRAPTAATLDVPAWQTLGVIIGPVLSLAGLLYLAALADALRALTRFAP
jgi:hypothetical protein